MDTTSPQPPPHGTGPVIVSQVIADLLRRAEMGAAKYGEPLKAFNGRNPLIDLYQELQDATLYTRQAIEEQQLTGLLPDYEIARLATEHEMISPFEAQQVRDEGGRRVISYGLSSSGYDMRLGPKGLLLAKPGAAPFDPKAVEAMDFVPLTIQQGAAGAYIIIPPHGFVLGSSIEYWQIPGDVAAIVQGKSSYARSGVHVLMTPMEPGWVGTLTLELFNTQSRPVRVYVGEGIAQAVFFRLPSRPHVTYADRAGKYQGQSGTTLPRM